MEKTIPTEEQKHWRTRLQNAGLADVTAAMIEAAGPLSILAAQGLYLAEPLLNGFSRNSSVAKLAEILEDREKSQQFADMLRKPVEK